MFKVGWKNVNTLLTQKETKWKKVNDQKSITSTMQGQMQKEALSLRALGIALGRDIATL